MIKYYVRECNDIEKVKCDVCNGTGKIVGTLTSDVLDKPIEGQEFACPHCGGTGQYPTGKVIHYAVGQVVLYGTAHVEDGDKVADYNLGFVCDDVEKIENFKTTNGITNFVDYPASLAFYADNTELYDTYEEALAIVNQKESEHAEGPNLTLVE